MSHPITRYCVSGFIPSNILEDEFFVVFRDSMERAIALLRQFYKDSGVKESEAPMPRYSHPQLDSAVVIVDDATNYPSLCVISQFSLTVAARYNNMEIKGALFIHDKEVFEIRRTEQFTSSIIEPRRLSWWDRFIGKKE